MNGRIASLSDRSGNILKKFSLRQISSSSLLLVQSLVFKQLFYLLQPFFQVQLAQPVHAGTYIRSNTVIQARQSNTCSLLETITSLRTDSSSKKNSKNLMTSSSKISTKLIGTSYKENYLRFIRIPSSLETNF